MKGKENYQNFNSAYMIRSKLTIFCWSSVRAQFGPDQELKYIFIMSAIKQRPFPELPDYGKKRNFVYGI